MCLCMGVGRLFVLLKKGVAVGFGAAEECRRVSCLARGQRCGVPVRGSRPLSVRGVWPSVERQGAYSSKDKQLAAIRIPLCYRHVVNSR